MIILHGLLPLHYAYVSPFLKRSYFSNISGFLKPFFALHNFNVFVETFFACFRQFYFLRKCGYFARAIAFALRPCSAIFKVVSFFEYERFFGAVFCIEQL